MTQTQPKRDIPKAYDPQAVEQRIYDQWIEGGYFTPVIDKSKEPFVIIMPPPNVTGELHMGHALTKAIQDMMVRWHRMLGDPTLYLPGTDHAGIATQVVVERMLASDGLTRHDLGREKFVERVWGWVDQYGNRIYEQVKRLGASCDWTRAGFTLDDGPSKAVRTTFVNLYNKGLVYRGTRITNWCSRCRTALSDLEVKFKETNGNLYHLRYTLDDGSGEVIIATTRPETLLGDTAVAVNPEDDRYSDLIGKTVTLPIVNRSIPIIGDEAVDKEFGTGALKVTPGHDPADFEIGQRHDLETINILNNDGTLNEHTAHYQGQDRLEARKAIVAELESDGVLVEVEPYHNSIGHCDRCDEVVEPIVSQQWYVKMEPLAKPARDAVANGEITIVPDRFTKVYFNWMDNIRDWCISRQLWWGHRIPVWYCADCDEVIVSMEDPTECTNCKSIKLTRDPDVLDTWFSSGLWTHSTLGWPEQTEDLDYFYPTSVMETGYDILFFWVARMIMAGIENMGQNPFHTIYLHGLVLDPAGIKMSKTKGNVLDPLELVDIYGADALRFALTTGNAPGNNFRLNERKLESSRNFANKLWNSARFAMSNLEDATNLKGWHEPARPVHRHDKWILSRLNRVTEQVDHFMKDFQFGEAQRVLHDFWWNEYCDWYIEMAKIRTRADDGEPSPLPTLAYVLERMLRLLHPFMPFITEEIWQTLNDYLPVEPDRPEALIIAPYPQTDASLFDDEAEEDIGALIEMVRAIRNLRAEFKIQSTQSLEAIVHSVEKGDIIEAEEASVKTFARVEPLRIANGDETSNVGDVSLVLSSGTVTVPLGGLVDIDAEKARLAEELSESESNITRLNKQLSNEQFLAKAPDEVVDRERQRLESIEDRRARISDILTRLSGS